MTTNREARQCAECGGDLLVVDDDRELCVGCGAEAERPAVHPRYQDEVTEKNQFLVSHHTLGTMKDGDGNLAVDVSQAGDYIKVRFVREEADDIKVVYSLDELATAAAEFAGYEPEG